MEERGHETEVDEAEGGESGTPSWEVESAGIE